MAIRTLMRKSTVSAPNPGCDSAMPHGLLRFHVFSGSTPNCSEISVKIQANCCLRRKIFSSAETKMP